MVYLLGREEDFVSMPVVTNEPLTKSEKQLLEIYRSLTEELRTLLIEQAKVIKNSELNSR